MLSLAEINAEIKNLEECENTTYSICQKLAILYIVRDHLPQKEEPVNMMPSMEIPSSMLK